MAKKKCFSVRLTDGIYREVLKSMRFYSEKEAEAAFIFACSLDDSLPFDIELSSFNLDTKTNQTSMWDSLRFRKYFDNATAREVFKSICGYAQSKVHLQAKALENNEKPYGTVCDWIKDDFSYERLSLKVQSDIAEAVCNFYGISIR